LAVQDFENVEKLLNDLVQKFPEDETLFDRVLNELFKDNRLEQAEAINQQFLKVFPNLETPFIYQGNLVLAREDTTNALSYFHKALQINPSYSEFQEYVTSLQEKFDKE
jgi:predicted Zn-dependent protease